VLAKMHRELSMNNNEQIPKDDSDVKLGAAKLCSYLREQEAGALHVETGSVYGVVVALPQISRSCGWPRGLTFVCVRGYFALFVNLVLQGWLIYLIRMESMVFDKYSGKMFVCDFGANLANCPDGDGCVGPDGTKYTPSRLYDYGAWSTRNYVRDSLYALFPDKHAEIEKNVDPGEFGMENPYCRLLCVFIFIMSLTSELERIIEGIWLMLAIPNKAEPWVRYEKPSWADKEHVKLVHGWTELDMVKIKIAGMPLHWKIINVLLVLLPKSFLWLNILKAGTSLLMDTGCIDDIIINSTALGFVLCIDELVFTTLTNTQTTTILNKLEDFPLFSVDQHENMEDHEAISNHEENEKSASLMKKLKSMTRMVPLNAIICSFTWVCAIMWYYTEHCTQTSDGTWVSKDIHVPRIVTLTWGQVFFPSIFSIPTEKDPAWSMPN